VELEWYEIAGCDQGCNELMILVDPIITPELCAQSIVDDYKMGSQYFPLVTKSISEQLSEFRASMSEETPVTSNPVKGCIEEDDATWWGNWRKRLRTEKGYVKIGKDESKPKRKSNGVPVKRAPDLVDMDIDIKPSVGNLDEHERELRVVLKVSFGPTSPLELC
jgi:SWI/SNF-related matrix-associated actin-dependent regulator of chromatin subfamily B protein 1